MKRTLLVSLALCFARVGLATDIVHDPVSMVNYTVHEALHYVQAAETQLNTLHAYEQQVIELTRLGDPAAIRNLAGTTEVGQLLASGQQVYQQYQQLPQVFSPNGYQTNANAILSQFGQPGWNGWATADGTQILPGQSAYQFDVSRYNLANQILALFKQNQTQRQTLQAQRDQLQQQLADATTTAEAQKVHAQLDNVNAALAQLDARDRQATEQGQQQQLKINAGQRVTQAARVEQRDAAEYQQIDGALSALPVPDNQPVQW